MTRACALSALLMSAAVAAAEPLPWNYTVTLKPANGADGIVLGNEIYWEYDRDLGVEKGTPYYIVQPITKNGYTRTGNPTTTDPVVGLFDFGYGDWEATQVLDPAKTYANNSFTLQYLFTADLGGGATQSVSGSVEGRISASGVFTSGTGNYMIGFVDPAEFDIDLNGRQAKLEFTASNHESHSTIDMTVTPVAVETPEPGTLALGGIGLAGALGCRVRLRRRTRHVGA